MPRIPVTVDPELEPIMARYLDLRRQELIALKAALDKEDYDSVIEFGHTLKGNGSSYGFPRLSELGRELEGAGAARDRDAAIELAGEVGYFLDNVDITFG
ncbi:Hpt domain-containing protein [Pseudodesulfovibrio indicus]|uniref:Hpt domain-containing protein n=1 Tax=Pseudodesulfovibrio indicus TaxID=1716143 RepID=A0A140D9J0_9BACT|nr:Hpt domain-containing protein [Pseudodesulfovibrio indicus]AMK09857.1 hypothetical protein AWY79_01395 [Pseudodesulfovibrio indicus]TDT87465.1 Hpt domain-containing protein [Pseudodesulfovibrio indicus]